MIGLGSNNGRDDERLCDQSPVSRTYSYAARTLMYGLSALSSQLINV